MTVIISGSDGIEFPDASDQTTAATGFGFKNRIINGAMVIDQRNAGASVTPTASTYTLDRWLATMSQASKFSIQQNAGSVTTPLGFLNYLGITSTSAYTVGAAESFAIQQRIEGFNIADLGFGTANAQPITISFWVRSSLTGTFGGSLRNSDNTRSYPYSYTISSANTWELKTITIVGDTTGTWLPRDLTNGSGLSLTFGLGQGSTLSGTAGAWATGNFVSATGATSVVGTNGATFYITGVQLEKGSTATSFDYRPYGTELALCQRYYYKIFPNDVGAPLDGVGGMFSTTTGRVNVKFFVKMRVAPTALEQSGTAGDYAILQSSSGTACTAVPTYQTSSADSALVNITMSGATQNSYAMLRAQTANAFLAWSAEL